MRTWSEKVRNHSLHSSVHFINVASKAQRDCLENQISWLQSHFGKISVAPHHSPDKIQSMRSLACVGLWSQLTFPGLHPHPSTCMSFADRPNPQSSWRVHPPHLHLDNFNESLWAHTASPSLLTTPLTAVSELQPLLANTLPSFCGSRAPLSHSTEPTPLLTCICWSLDLKLRRKHNPTQLFEDRPSLPSPSPDLTQLLECSRFSTNVGYKMKK